ncbi:MAG: lamin tail domain-containing protein, partial [Planctomycetota bacterium]
MVSDRLEDWGALWTAVRTALLTVCALFCSSGSVDANGLLITEIHADPVLGEPAFIELYNASRRSVNLSGAVLSADGDVVYAFPSGAELRGFAYLVISSSAEAHQKRYGERPFGAYSGRLDSRGKVTISRRGADLVRADFDSALHELSHGSGASLELPALERDPRDLLAWRPSLSLGGTPGAINSVQFAGDRLRVVPQEATWRLFRGTREPSKSNEPLTWTLVDYDDSPWEPVPTPIGFGNPVDRTRLDDMRSNYSSVYLRRVFRIRNAAGILEATLSIDYDDGFVAYVNGQEIARRNAGEPGVALPHDGVADDVRLLEGVRESIRINLSGIAQDGLNVLAIHALNSHVRSNDFLIHPELQIVVADRKPSRRAPLVLNEAWKDESGRVSIEIYNAGATVESLGGYALRPLDAERRDEQPLPLDATITSRGFYVVRLDEKLHLENSLGLFQHSEERETLIAALRSPTLQAGTTYGRFPDGSPDLRSLSAASPAAANRPSQPGSVAISEIHYNPAEGDQEFVEILARDAVDLAGWTLTQGVRFSFPDRQLRPGDRIVVARDPVALLSQYAHLGVDEVLGPWSGRLSNRSELLLLFDRDGREVDRVEYSDDGNWPSETDGFGPSLELIDFDLENESGLAWRASAKSGGTPGLRNSVENSPFAPIIASVDQWPLTPKAGQAVEISARFLPSDAKATLYYRREGDASYRAAVFLPGPHASVATLPGFEEQSLVEFYVEVAN